jgi:hypothetical protein
LIHVVNQPPEISCSYDDEIWLGEMWSLRPEATDPGDDVLTWSVEPLPSTAWFDQNTGDMDWEPGADEMGWHTLVLTVEDDDGGAQSVEVVVEVRSEKSKVDSGIGGQDSAGATNRDSGLPEPGQTIIPGSNSEKIGCTCSSRPQLGAWRWLIFVMVLPLFRRCH